MNERWDVRDQDDMDALRADLIGCPASLMSAVMAEFSGDPLAVLGSRVMRGPFRIPTDQLRGTWREFIYNIIPVDGRHPHPPAVARLLEAAELHGWTDPRPMAPQFGM